MTVIPNPLREAAARRPTQPALLTRRETYSYEQFYVRVRSTAARLTELGIASGDRVGILATNCVAYPHLLPALFELGAVACPLSTRYPPRMRAAALKRINCRSVIAGNAFRNPELGSDVCTLSLDEIFASEDRPLLDLKGSNALNQDATIMFTSGSTSVPKAVLHTYGNHYYSALGSNENIRFKRGDRWLLSLPLYHVGGLAILFRTMLSGAAAVIPEQDESLVKSVAKYDVTHVSMVPTQIYRVLESSEDSTLLKRLKAVLVGGGNMSPDLYERCRRAGLPVYLSYGLTEMASQVTTTRPEDLGKEHKTSGSILNYRQLKVADEGEILVKGRTLFKGYVDGNTVSLPIDSEGWFHTGDVGSLDEGGNLTVVGRADTMFVSGGENIYPEVIESHLMELTEIEHAVVVPVNDEELGQRPVAFVKCCHGHFPGESDFSESLRHLPRFMQPVAYFEWPDEITSSRMKPDRKELTELAARLRLKR